MLFASRLARETFLGETAQNPWSASLLATIRSARTHIRLLYPTLNVQEVRRGRIDAVRRGTRVELVLAKGFNQEWMRRPFQEGNQLFSGTRPPERFRALPPREQRARLDLRWHSRDGPTRMDGTGKGASHAKYASFDD